MLVVVVVMVLIKSVVVLSCAVLCHTVEWCDVFSFRHVMRRFTELSWRVPHL